MQDMGILGTDYHIVNWDMLCHWFKYMRDGKHMDFIIEYSNENSISHLMAYAVAVLGLTHDDYLDMRDNEAARRFPAHLAPPNSPYYKPQVEELFHV